jgi:hypothetical protein
VETDKECVLVRVIDFENVFDTAGEKEWECELDEVSEKEQDSEEGVTETLRVAV